MATWAHSLWRAQSAVEVWPEVSHGAKCVKWNELLDYVNEQVNYVNEQIDYVNELLDYVNEQVDYVNEQIGYVNEQINYVNEWVNYALKVSHPIGYLSIY